MFGSLSLSREGEQEGGHWLAGLMRIKKARSVREVEFKFSSSSSSSSWSSCSFSASSTQVTLVAKFHLEPGLTGCLANEQEDQVKRGRWRGMDHLTKAAIRHNTTTH